MSEIRPTYVLVHTDSTLSDQKMQTQFNTYGIDPKVGDLIIYPNGIEHKLVFVTERILNLRSGIVYLIYNESGEETADAIEGALGLKGKNVGVALANPVDDNDRKDEVYN